MTDREKECLEQDDIRLFHHGACHVFAIALQTYFPEEQYRLKRVERIKDLDTQSAVHVVAFANNFIVDASGIKRNDDYVQWLRKRPYERRFSAPVQVSVTLHDTDSQELLSHVAEDATQELASINCFGLFVGTEFIAESQHRATQLIEHWPQKYMSSILSHHVAHDTDTG